MHNINPLKAQLIPICHLLALLGAHHVLHVSRIRVNIQQFYVLPTQSCSCLLKVLLQLVRTGDFNGRAERELIGPGNCSCSGAGEQYSVELT
jgi:hypothetical protein